jgi:hypothetical protein
MFILGIRHFTYTTWVYAAAMLIGEILVMSGAFFVLFSILICCINNDKKRHYGPYRSTYIPKYRRRRMKKI